MNEEANYDFVLSEAAICLLDELEISEEEWRIMRRRIIVILEEAYLMPRIEGTETDLKDSFMTLRETYDIPRYEYSPLFDLINEDINIPIGIVPECPYCKNDEVLFWKAKAGVIPRTNLDTILSRIR